MGGWWWVVVACEIILSSPGTGCRGTLYFPFPFSHFHFPIPISHPQSPGPGPVPVAWQFWHNEYKSQNFLKCTYFLTFIIPLCHIHDVGDFLSPTKQVFELSIEVNHCLLEEWDAGYGGLVSYEHTRSHLITVHPPALAKDTGRKIKKSKKIQEVITILCYLVNSPLSLLVEAWGLTLQHRPRKSVRDIAESWISLG